MGTELVTTYQLQADLTAERMSESQVGPLPHFFEKHFFFKIALSVCQFQFLSKSIMTESYRSSTCSLLTAKLHSLLKERQKKIE